MDPYSLIPRSPQNMTCFFVKAGGVYNLKCITGLGCGHAYRLRGVKVVPDVSLVLRSCHRADQFLNSCFAGSFKSRSRWLMALLIRSCASRSLGSNPDKRFDSSLRKVSQIFRAIAIPASVSWASWLLPCRRAFPPPFIPLTVTSGVSFLVNFLRRRANRLASCTRRIAF